MSQFVVNMVDALTREVLDTEDEVFDNEEDAQEYACEWGGSFAQGAECLSSIYAKRSSRLCCRRN